MSMERLQASYRSRHPLDWVIMNARQEEEAAAAAEAVEKTALAKARQQREDADVKKLLRRQGGGSPGKRGGKSPGKRSPGKRGGKTQAPGRGSRRPVAGVEEEAYTVFDASADASAAAVRQQAQLMAGTRTTSFTAAQQLFNGRVEVTRRYPHDMDQSALRRAITAPKRIGELNAEVQAARERRAEKEAARVADVELAAEDAVGWQPDGGKLRLGRIGQPSEWDYSGELFKRGQVATWKWTRGFFVLCVSPSGHPRATGSTRTSPRSAARALSPTNRCDRSRQPLCSTPRQVRRPPLRVHRFVARGDRGRGVALRGLGRHAHTHLDQGPPVPLPAAHRALLRGGGHARAHAVRGTGARGARGVAHRHRPHLAHGADALPLRGQRHGNPAEGGGRQGAQGAHQEGGAGAARRGAGPHRARRAEADRGLVARL